MWAVSLARVESTGLTMVTHERRAPDVIMNYLPTLQERFLWAAAATR